MKTLKECIESLKKYGFTEDFLITEEEVLKAYNSDKTYAPEEISVPNFYRFEGISDPSDMSILYAIKTSDGLKGTLTDAYGTYANEHVNNFIKRVEAIGKVTDRNKDFQGDDSTPDTW